MAFSALQRFFGPSRESDDVARAFTRVFHSDDGRMVLEHLHRLTLFRVTDPGIGEHHLRFIEGQRQLVLLICQMATKV